ncbi:odorant binding protein 7 [Megalopta genalis]|uniref:odorant binding protein 7 n=1 Tax=Megalopta genalis TaxID=115081 RepID=UPI003FD28824
MNSVHIFVFLLFASCVTVRGFEVQHLADILGIPKSQYVECVEGNDLDKPAFIRISQLLGAKELNAEDQKLMNRFSCFLACIFTKGKIMDEGKIQFDTILQLADENDVPLTAEMKENLNVCIDEANKKLDNCEASLAFSTCVNDRWFRYGQ